MSIFPLTIVRRRREPRNDRQYSNTFRAVLPLAFEPQSAPEPVDYSSFYAVGRDPYHIGRTHDIFIETAIPEKLAVAGWPFMVERDIAAASLMMPTGRMNPLQERVNIESRGSMAYGDMAAVKASPFPVPFDLMKLA